MGRRGKKSTESVKDCIESILTALIITQKTLKALETQWKRLQYIGTQMQLFLPGHKTHQSSLVIQTLQSIPNAYNGLIGHGFRQCLNCVTDISTLTTELFVNSTGWANLSAIREQWSLNDNKHFQVSAGKSRKHLLACEIKDLENIITEPAFNLSKNFSLLEEKANTIVHTLESQLVEGVCQVVSVAELAKVICERSYTDTTDLIHAIDSYAKSCESDLSLIPEYS